MKTIIIASLAFMLGVTLWRPWQRSVEAARREATQESSPALPPAAAMDFSGTALEDGVWRIEAPTDLPLPPGQAPRLPKATLDVPSVGPGTAEPSSGVTSSP